MTPGIAWFTDRYQVSLGTQVALDRTAVSVDRESVIILINIVLPRFFPGFHWTPF